MSMSTPLLLAQVPMPSSSPPPGLECRLEALALRAATERDASEHGAPRAEGARPMPSGGPACSTMPAGRHAEQEPVSCSGPNQPAWLLRSLGLAGAALCCRGFAQGHHTPHAGCTIPAGPAHRPFPSRIRLAPCLPIAAQVGGATFGAGVRRGSVQEASTSKRAAAAGMWASARTPNARPREGPFPVRRRVRKLEVRCTRAHAHAQPSFCDSALLIAPPT